MNTDTATIATEQPEASVERKQMFHWQPSEEAIKQGLRVAGLGAAVLGALGFALSFRSVGNAAIPYLGGLAFVLPFIIDLGIAVLTILSLVLALAGMPSRLVSLIPNLLSAYTLYLNCADQKSIYGAVIHGAGPLMWITVVEIGGMTIRRLVGLEHVKPKIERMRLSLWALRPGATFRLWRQMRIQQIRTYREAVDRDAARAVVVGRMRLHHGRRWRTRAPLAERIALRLQGQSTEGVAAQLTAHQTTADLLSGITPDAAPQAPAATAPVPAQPATAPAPAPRSATAVKPPRAPRQQTPGVGRVRTAQTRTDAELADAAEALERAALAASGGASGISYRAAQDALNVGYPKAKKALDAARARINAPVATVVIPAPLAHANGSAVTS